MTPARVAPIPLARREQSFWNCFARVLIDADEGRHAFAFGVLRRRTDVARPFGSDQNHVDIFGRRDRFEMNRKPVRKEQRLARR